MKTIYSILLALALCGGVAVLPVAVTGCKTTSAQTTAYKTLSSIGTAVNSAYAGFLDQAVAGKVSGDKVKAISIEYQVFQTAFSAAVSLAQGNVNATASQSVLDAGANVLREIAASKGK